MTASFIADVVDCGFRWGRRSDIVVSIGGFHGQDGDVTVTVTVAVERVLFRAVERRERGIEGRRHF